MIYITISSPVPVRHSLSKSTSSPLVCRKRCLPMQEAALVTVVPYGFWEQGQVFWYCHSLTLLHYVLDYVLNYSLGWLPKQDIGLMFALLWTSTELQMLNHRRETPLLGLVPTDLHKTCYYCEHPYQNPSAASSIGRRSCICKEEVQLNLHCLCTKEIMALKYCEGEACSKILSVPFLHCILWVLLMPLRREGGLGEMWGYTATA